MIIERGIVKNSPAMELFMKLNEDAIDEKMKTEKTHLLVEGVYNYKYSKEYEFVKGMLTIENMYIEKINLTVSFEVQIIKPVIVSKFDIESKGRYLEQEFIPTRGGKIKTFFVAIKFLEKASLCYKTNSVFKHE